MTKTCVHCGEVKTLDAFNRHTKGKLGRSSYCRPCTSERNRAYRDVNRGRLREYRKARLTPAYKRASDLWSKYRLRVEDWDRMLIAQCGRCRACGDTMMDPHVDHCHASGRVRALLCTHCNKALGLLREDPARITGLLSYALDVRVADQRVQLGTNPRAFISRGLAA